MKAMNVLPVVVDFDKLPFEIYEKYLRRAEFAKEKGYFYDVSVIELAKRMYEKDACQG